jgi:mono/diheme cytochrome c family protein
MKRIIKRLLVGLAAFVVVAVAALLTAIFLLEDRRFDAPYPELRASADPEVVARGRYLVYGPAHCVGCHGAPGARDARGDARVPLSGGVSFELPIGSFHAPNITPDLATGIGARSDGEIARALRHGVGHDGRALMPFMPFANLSDEDLVAVISFLRSEPPVANPVPPADLNLLGRAIRAFVMRPVGPSHPPRATSPAGATVERGEYLASSVANCVGCHTARDMVTGAFIGEPYAGGFEMNGHVTRNLTPDPKTGWIRSWSEDDFVARMRSGIGPEGSHMPWREFARMSEDDMRAIHRFLQTVKPVENDTGGAAKVAAAR